MQRRRVLVVDDEPSIVDAVATSLRYEGFEVEEQSDGRRALVAAQERAFDLIVLDVMLPSVTGVEICHRLRSDGIETPVLFLTARSDPAERIAGLRAGGDDYVVKPFVLGEVLARVHAILRRADRVLETGVLRFGDIVLDEAARTTRHRDGAARGLLAARTRVMSLRTRLVLGALCALALALATADVLVYRAMRQHLVARLDRSLREAQLPLGPSRGARDDKGGDGRTAGSQRAGDSVFVRILSANGPVERSVLATLADGTTASPRLPAVIDTPIASDDPDGPAVFFEAPSAEPQGRASG